MSFILDALKKSENERQRQSGPALFEVKVATPRPGLPAWAIALGVLLVVNISVVIWLVLRKPAQGPVSQHAAAVPAATLAPAPAVAAPLAAAPTPAPAPPAQSTQPPEPASDETTQPDESAADTRDSETLNAEDYEPAVSASSRPPAETGGVTRGTVEGFPTYEQLAASSSVPEVKLDMHVYAAKPQDRFVFINMQRLREGDSLPNGVRVEQITPDGVVLSHRGSRFVLERE
jgi:general secretion pathway protein B